MTCPTGGWALHLRGRTAAPQPGQTTKKRWSTLLEDRCCAGCQSTKDDGLTLRVCGVFGVEGGQIEGLYVTGMNYHAVAEVQ